jgi:hypothetical protein
MNKINIIVIFILAVIVGIGQLKKQKLETQQNFFDVSSKGIIRREHQETVCSVYSESNFMGREYSLIKGQYNQIDMQNIGITEKDIASLKVTDGYAAIVFQNENFSGRKFLIKDHSFCLPEGFYKNIKSLKIIRLQSGYDLPIISYISNPIKEKDNIYIKGSNFQSDDLYVTAIDSKGDSFELEVNQTAEEFIILKNELGAGKYYVTVNAKNNVSNEYEMNIISKDNKEPMIKFIKKASDESQNLSIQGLNFQKDISKVVVRDKEGGSKKMEIIAINRHLIMVKNNLVPGQYSAYVENENVRSKEYRFSIN